VPISAILFGGRRKTTIPLVTESRDWAHGVFMGATLSSETTAAATGAVGVVRRDPMAMLPFIGYNAADYLDHWLAVGKQADAAKLPKIFYVNWFRRDDDGGFLWPGFSENSRVLKWVVERIEGTAAAVETPIGRVPTPESLDVDGLDLSPEALERVLAVVPAGVAQGDPADPGVVRQDRFGQGACRALDRARRSQGPARQRLGKPAAISRCLGERARRARGCMGRRGRERPGGRTASWTALTTAGSDPIAPASPTPLDPSGVAGDGVQVRSVMKDGKSEAAGMVSSLRLDVTKLPSSS